MAIAIIIIVSFFLRLLFLPQWLDEWDSVQFSLAIRNYDITIQQPHTSGYILFVFLARMVNLIFKNEANSLLILSTTLGALSALPLYLLLKRVANVKIALLGSALFVATPNHWLLSIMGLSNIPGLFFGLVSILFLYLGKSSNRYFYIGAFLSGLTLGVRLAEYSILIALLFYVLIQDKIQIKKVIISTLLFVLGILVWLIPMILDTGAANFLSVYYSVFNYIVSHDSLIEGNGILKRLVKFVNLFLSGFSVFYLPLILVTISLLLSKFKGNLKDKFDKNFALIWLLSYLIPLVLFYNLEDPIKYSLPLLPPFVVLFCLSVKNVLKDKHFFLLSTLIFLVFLKSLSLVIMYHELVPATIAPVLYISKNYPAGQTTLITSFTFRQFQYYTPRFNNYFSGQPGTPSNVQTKYLIIDYIDIKDKIENIDEYELIDQKTFEGPKEVFPRVNKTNLYIYKRYYKSSQRIS